MAVDKLRATAARRTTEPRPGATAASTTTATTVKLDPRVWAELQAWMGKATVEAKQKIKIGAVGAALYELLLDDPDLQARVIRHLT